MNNYLYIGNIHLLDSNEEYEKAYNSLSSQRKDKVDHYCFDKDKKLSILAEILLKRALEDLNIKSSFKYKYYSFLKPYLDDIDDIKFNISHSGEYTICLVSDREVGCDIEHIDNDKLKIAKQFMSENELAHLANMDNKLDYFYRIWTLKESFIKSIGNGLSIDLRSISFDINDNISIKQYINDNNYYFKEINIDGYKCSVCLLNDKPLVIKQLDSVNSL